MATSDKLKPSMVVDDDDLDDLDDVLDQFTPASRPNAQQSPGDALVSPPPPPPTATATAFSRPRTNTRIGAPPKSVPGSGRGLNLETTDELNEDELSEAFSRELQEGMESLMRELGGSSLSERADEKHPEGGLDDDDEAERRLRTAWEAMLVDGMDGMVQGSSQDAGEKGGTSMGGANLGNRDSSNPFQDQIRQAMDKLRESESNLQDHSQTADGTPESLEALLASLNDLGLVKGEGEGEGDGDGDDPELSNLLNTVMNQLMSKEILYEPLKELAEGFPPYLANPPAPISDNDRKQYDSQLKCVRKILAVFSDPDYDDSNHTMKASITNLMNELQTYGSPPTEIMGPLPAGMKLGPDGTPEGCVIA